MLTHIQLIPYFEKFISDSKSGKRLKKNGVKITAGTIQNYESVLKILILYETRTRSNVIIPLLKGNNVRENKIVRNFWIKFNKSFVSFLHKDRNVFDNYVGFNIKIIRTFLNWLKNNKGLNIGEFYKCLYIRKEEIPILTFSINQLRKLMYDLDFENTLPINLKKVKDMLVLGCLTSLRYSDLQRLKKRDIIHRDGQYYLSTTSKKTGISILIRLPIEALQLVQNGRILGKKLCYSVTLTNFNKNIKKICELAGWVYPVEKNRSIYGKSISNRNSNEKIGIFRFCDLVSSHIMRRTAITNLLMLGVSELTVRKISGHTETSSSFMRYVNLAQSYIDTELENAHLKLKEKVIFSH